MLGPVLKEREQFRQDAASPGVSEAGYGQAEAVLGSMCGLTQTREGRAVWST